MKKIIAFALVCMSSLAVYSATSPVVQVVSYKEPLGLYYLLQGWGSGSIIDNAGHIITNNHVVDDGLGGISDDFSICMTEDPSIPPKCHYTASVISRDADLDIAVLQIDPTDIFGQKVNFTNLSILPINMDYAPKSGDTVLARGYPWVGANTITETQGIVSGAAQYNGKRYIKTDTLIAGGNSGGPLIQEGKMVGVNTFLVGGGYDPALGYSLLISEAADFIQEALLNKETIQSNNPEFPKFLQNIDTFSMQRKIVDPLITFNLSEKYTIMSYIPSTSLEAELADSNMTSVESFGFYHLRTPHLADIQALKNYILMDLDSETRNSLSLSQVTIGGKVFYEVVDAKNPENDKTKSYFAYIMMIDETHSIMLYLTTPDPTQNTLDKIQKSVKNFLGSVSFSTVFTFPKTQNIIISDAEINIETTPSTIVSYDIQDYTGLLEYSILDRENFVMARNFLGNASLYAQIAVFKNSFETEDKTIDQWMEKSTEYFRYGQEKPTINKKITYKGHEGFLICANDTYTDDTDKENDSITCETVFFVGEKSDYILSAEFILPRAQDKKIDILIQRYLDRILQVPEIGNTEFNTQKSPKALPYSDVGNQSEAFQEVLGQLLSYGLLTERSVFDGDSPLTWKAYISLYIKAVYNRNMNDIIDPKNPESPTFEKALSSLPIAWGEYAEGEEYYLDRLHLLMRLRIAGGSFPSYDMVTISEFENDAYNRTDYKNEWAQINAFEEKYFPNRVSPESVKYTSEFVTTYNSLTGLTKKLKTDNSWNDRFLRDSAKDKADAEQVVRCEKSSVAYFSHGCVEMRKNNFIEMMSYTVLTKGKAIEIILPNMDYTLWDPSLAPKNEAVNAPTE